MDDHAARLLLVDADPRLTEMLGRSLRFVGFDVVIAASGGEAAIIWEREPLDLLLIDPELPDVNGFDMVRELRGRGLECPVLFLVSAEAARGKSGELTVGGDRYLLKPFSLDEVVAQVETVLRRTTNRGARQLCVADLELDEDSHEVRRAGVPLRLTPMERRLLRYLMRHAGTAVSRLEIQEHVWPYEDMNTDARTLDVHISSLRRKINKLGSPLIHTLYGVGYTLRLPHSRHLRANPDDLADRVGAAS